MVFDDPTLLALAFGRCAGWVATVPIFGPIRPTATGRIALAIVLGGLIAGGLVTVGTPEQAGDSPTAQTE